MSASFHATVKLTPAGVSTKLAALLTSVIVASLIANIALGFTEAIDIVFSALFPFLSKTVTLISCLTAEPSVPLIDFVATS